MEITSNGDHRQQRHNLTLYAVQRRWHSGPRNYAPLDMLRLFRTQREAEEAAFHSATAYCEAVNNNNNNNNNQNSGDISNPSKSSIKTTILPSYPTHNPGKSSFGFLAGGSLFWVRALHATVITSGSILADTHSNGPIYAIMTEGVIGGSGNPTAQRGTEICDGRVFGGDATACAIAMEAVKRVQEQANCGTTGAPNRRLRVEAKVVWIGKPPNADRWYSSGAFLKDCWAEEQVIIGEQDAAMDDGNSLAVKRQINGNNLDSVYGGGYLQTVSTELDEGPQQSGNACMVDTNENLLIVDCPFEQPIAKRRRIVSVSEDCYPSAFNNPESAMHTMNNNLQCFGVRNNFNYLGAISDFSNGNHHHHEDDNDDNVGMMP
eukprot:CAMPEP_0172377808 /NCGR_PEP_ID=MMETSP1060-20121228/69102_1 /TAXON_ID=37318 /ORGANISM="Pseudo-nitzschia pungens, Strain cf. cingulata" /LENGTH=375 /DNA_ID=CAMNT_0013105517 /DNA_START=886 /DNA_END=2013 /DNA_ORIENTATION=-